MVVRTSVALLLFVSLLLSGTSAGGDPIRDREITESLQQAFDRDHRFRQSELQVSTYNGSVTLKGTVSRYVDKDEAERIAKRTSGVTSIVNMISVDFSAGDDDRILEDIRGRLARSLFVRADDVNVRVDHGVVTLTGTVNSWQESDQIERLAREVRGVQQLRNDITTSEPSSHSSDAQIAANVELKLERDAYLAGYALHATVESGVVRLTGEVPNLFHKDRAGDEARLVAGVRRVDNELVVVSQAILESHLRSPSEADIKQSVEDELRADPRVGSEGIEVLVSGGDTRLEGWVDSMFAKQTAERIAKRVFGVARVHNQLTVQAVKRNDDEIRADILSNFESDAILEGESINVQVHNGAVTLSGEVKGNSVKIHVLRLTARVSGVREIHQQLQVAKSNLPADEVIMDRIRESLAANAITRGISERIVVAIDQGEIVLTGNVDRWSEAIEAVRIANRADGVRSVDNRLQLQP